MCIRDRAMPRSFFLFSVSGEIWPMQRPGKHKSDYISHIVQPCLEYLKTKFRLKLIFLEISTSSSQTLKMFDARVHTIITWFCVLPSDNVQYQLRKMTNKQQQKMKTLKWYPKLIWRTKSLLNQKIVPEGQCFLFSSPTLQLFSRNLYCSLFFGDKLPENTSSVSYTHLTLPTKA